MATQAINGITTYEITIGNTREQVTGTHDEAWERVVELMKGQPSGTIPRVRPVTSTPSTPVKPTAQSAGTEDVSKLTRGVDVSTEGKARSTGDLLAAQAAGFAPKRPLYDRGTLVVDWGVDNARKSRVEHDAKPRVAEAVAAFVDTIKAENRRDVIVDPAQLAMRGNGQVVGTSPEGWHIEAEALSQLATRIGIEQPAYLHGIWPELRAMNWNQHLATMLGHDKSTCPKDHPARTRLAEVVNRKVRARLRSTSDGEAAVWAALSERYAAYDVDQIAQALEIGMRGTPDARCEVMYDGRNAQFDVLFHSNVQPTHYVAGEFFMAGMRVRTSDAGGGSINVGLLLWQNLCLNLIVLDVGHYSIDKIRHLGDPDKLATRFASAVKEGNNKLAHFLKAWGYACEESLGVVTSTGIRPEHLTLLDELKADTISESDLLTGIFRGIVKQGDMSLNKSDLPGLLAAHALDNSGAKQLAPVTRASVVNAITRYAHTDVGRLDPLRASDLESEAGALLVSRNGRGNPAPLPFWPMQ